MKTNNRLFCFSPPVMLATFLIEFGLLIYVLWRYKLNKVTRLVVLILLFLGIFQLSEFMICGWLGWTGVEWARFGYASITMLPPLGLHLATVLAKKRLPWLIGFAYFTAALFIYFFVFVSGSMSGEICMPNYIVFHVHSNLVFFYILYYYGWLLISVYLTLLWSKKSKAARQLKALAVGYSVFIVPTTIANVIDPSTISGIPSIMCGFAVLLAIVLVGWVVPGSAKLKS